MTMFAKAAIALCVAIIQSGGPAYADFVFLSCGASAGSTYYMEGGMVSAANAGWQKDGIDAGIQLLIKDDKSFDLISKGPPPNDFKYSDHGCKFGTVSLSSAKNELVVSAHCPNQVEVFFFNWKDDKTGEVVRVDIASSGLSKHGGALHATCQLGEH
jgi:hypothetical protein